jgi:hypothetical protein
VKKGRTSLPLREARRNYFDAAGAAAAEAASDAEAFLALCAFLAGAEAEAMAEAEAGAEAMAIAEAEAEVEADAAAKAEAANREATRAAMILDILISSWLRNKRFVSESGQLTCPFRWRLTPF